MSLQTSLVREMGRYDGGKWAGLVGLCTGTTMEWRHDVGRAPVA